MKIHYGMETMTKRYIDNEKKLYTMRHHNFVPSSKNIKTTKRNSYYIRKYLEKKKKIGARVPNCTWDIYVDWSLTYKEKIYLIMAFIPIPK